MRIFLLLLVALAAIGECHGGSKYNNRLKRDLLLRSKRRWVLSTIDLEENMNVVYPFKISQMFNDKTEGKRYKFVISGEGVEEGLFSIGESSGEVFVHKPFDREEKDTYHITFDVFDQAKNAKIDRELAFDVDIKDINDNAPKFIKVTRTANVYENAEEGYLAATVEATDADKEKTENSTVVINVTSQTPAEPKINAKQLDDRQARLELKGCFDYDKAKEFKVTVTASDKGKPPLSTSTVITLKIIDCNSHLPRFKERQYHAEALEMSTHDDILRIAVEDKDTPDTDGWRAKYYFIKGNEEEIFTIKTDPKTNEGILSVVKMKNYYQNTLLNVTIGVENIEPLIICKNNKLTKDPKLLPPKDSVNVTVTMLDTNDAPMFEKYSDDVYQTEESEPGQVLYTPRVQDIDSPNFRFVLVEDPAGWMTIDEKTGAITTAKKMDRESPFVDKDNVYRVVIAAIDDGQPPATSTCTIKVHLRDINDNTPKLINSSVIFCQDKVKKIMVPARDADAEPFSGPFIFELEEEEAKNNFWKLDPSHGEVVGLVPQIPLSKGNYSVPLLIQDQQNMVGHEAVEVEVCDCGGSNLCVRTLSRRSANIGDAAIGLIIAGLLLLLLLLLGLTCIKTKKPLKIIDDTVHQTLIPYNEEGIGVDCRAENLLRVNSITVTDGITETFVKNTETVPGIQTMPIVNTVTTTTMNYNYSNAMGSRQQRSSRRSYDGSFRAPYQNGDASRRVTLQRRTSSYKSSMSNRIIERQLKMMIEDVLKRETDPQDTYQQEFQPVNYANEGNGSKCQSLEALNFDAQDDNLSFLNSMGPKFNTLGEMCSTSAGTKMQL